MLFKEYASIDLFKFAILCSMGLRMRFWCCREHSIKFDCPVDFRTHFINQYSDIRTVSNKHNISAKYNLFSLE